MQIQQIQQFRYQIHSKGFSQAQHMETQMIEMSFSLSSNSMRDNAGDHPHINQMNDHFIFATNGLHSAIAKKVGKVVKVLNQDVIDIRKLKECLAEGIPDEAAIIRQYTWKLVLDFLPKQKRKWQSTIEKEKRTYQQFVHMFLPKQNFKDYPLSLGQDHPRFKQLQHDYFLWEQIEKDTSRTHAQFSFFSTKSKNIMIPFLTNARRQKFKLINGEDYQNNHSFQDSKENQRTTYRYDYMSRILFIYSKLNPKIQYVQGMNEILAPIFYLVNATKTSHQIDQAACFFMFNSAISDVIELHIKDFDKSRNGIAGKLSDFNNMLAVIDPILWMRMQKLKIDPFFYCFRWFTLLFAQDFVLFDTLRLWQGIFSNQDHLQFTSFIAIAILESCRNIILGKDFSVILQHLQNLKNYVNVNEILKKAYELSHQFNNDNFNQIALKWKKTLVKKQSNKICKNVNQKEIFQHKVKKVNEIQKITIKEQQYEQQLQNKQEMALAQDKKQRGMLNKFTNFVDQYF